MSDEFEGVTWLVGLIFVMALVVSAGSTCLLAAGVVWVAAKFGYPLDYWVALVAVVIIGSLVGGGRRG